MRWAAFTGVVMACLFVAVGSSGSTPGPRYVVSAARLPSYRGIVEILGPKGGVQRVLSRNSGGWPAASWSPNGTMVAWVDRQGLKIAHADGSGVRLLVRASRTCTFCMPMTFAWSPTGRQLLIGGAGPQTGRFLTVGVRSGVGTNLVVPRRFTEYRVLGWSPNGRLIAYTRTSGRYQSSVELFVARADGSGARRIHTFEDPFHDTPYGSWSPGSRSIAFTSDGRDRGDPNFGIVDVATGRLRRITTVGQLGVVTPAWSPDSRRLAVIGAQVLTLDPTGHNVRRLGTTLGAHVVWTRSGALFVVRGDHENQVLVSPDGRERPHFLFQLKKQAILALDVRP
jgi:WD40 repeat protein